MKHQYQSIRRRVEMKRKHIDLTQEELKTYVYYNHLTGVFKRKKSLTNSIKNGSRAGSITSDGYIRIRVAGVAYQAHRIAWLYHYGYDAEGMIDHINRDKKDNRIKNLREVSLVCNVRNSGISKNNKTGVTGVFFNKQKNKYEASIGINGDNVLLGRFSDKDDAVICRWLAEKEHDYPKCNTTSTALRYLQKNCPEKIS